jgi:flagellar hook-associated protein FlgK
MSTRSTISIKTPEGKIRSIYCHYDGYLKHNGELLKTHYNNESAASNLIELGDISSLASTLETTVAYHRDRKETLHITVVDDIKDIDSQDYNYLFKDGKWFFWKWSEHYDIKEL